MTGMGFDLASCALGAGNACMYATAFIGKTIGVFDDTGAFLGTCGAVGATTDNVESVVAVPSNGGLSIIAGQATYAAGAGGIESTGPLPCGSGETFTSHAAAQEGKGTDWVDVAADKCTVLYTSEGLHVLSYNICTNTQNANFAGPLTGPYAFALKILPDGGVIVADSSHATHVSNTGTIINSCDSASPGITGFLGFGFSMDVLPGATAFAMGTQGTNQIDYLTLAHCDAGQTAPDFSFVDACPNNPSTCNVQGVAIFGEIQVSSPPHGVPEFPGPSMLVAALGLLAVAVVSRKGRLQPTTIAQ
jgi:hypothetical protein